MANANPISRAPPSPPCTFSGSSPQARGSPSSDSLFLLPARYGAHLLPRRTGERNLGNFPAARGGTKRSLLTAHAPPGLTGPILPPKD